MFDYRTRVGSRCADRVETAERNFNVDQEENEIKNTTFSKHCK